MIHSLSHTRFRTAIMMLLAGILVVSCGSYQQASYYDNDGIYGNDNVRVVEKNPRTVTQKKKPDQYSEYFGQMADGYGDILDSEVFTDVDSYSSNIENDSIANEGDIMDYYSQENDYDGYAGWGDNATDVNINIYGGGGYGFNNPWFIGGWNSWGWNNWGWNNWGWNRLGLGQPLSWIWIRLGRILQPLVLSLLWVWIRLWT